MPSERHREGGGSRRPAPRPHCCVNHAGRCLRSVSEDPEQLKDKGSFIVHRDKSKIGTSAIRNVLGIPKERSPDCKAIISSDPARRVCSLSRRRNMLQSSWAHGCLPQLAKFGFHKSRTDLPGHFGCKPSSEEQRGGAPPILSFQVVSFPGRGSFTWRGQLSWARQGGRRCPKCQAHPVGRGGHTQGGNDLLWGHLICPPQALVCRPVRGLQGHVQRWVGDGEREWRASARWAPRGGNLRPWCLWPVLKMGEARMV